MIFSEHARMVDINLGRSEIYGHFCDTIQEMLSTKHLTNNLFSASFSSSQDQFLVVSLDFSVTNSFRPFHGPGVDSAPSENEYQEHFLGVKAAGA